MSAMTQRERDRRTLLREGLVAVGALAAGPAWVSCRSAAAATSPWPTAPRPFPGHLLRLGPLRAPDTHGLRLPVGFTSRVVARSGIPPVAGSPYLWHGMPDGGATFATPDGGWIYVSNSERDDGHGGAGALRFAADGTLRAAYPVLQGTTRNCAGGPTPWGTWLSCEEFPRGRVWECDPFGQMPAVVHPALGVFAHEAAAVDPSSGSVYLTEDERDGRLYRFVPASPPVGGRSDFARGALEVAAVSADGQVTWLPVPDPGATATPTRRQVAASSVFDGGEGIWHHDGVIYMSTKGDNCLRALDLRTHTMTLLYDDDRVADPELTGVDNVTATPAGDIVVAEDGGNMQVVALGSNGRTAAIVEIDGHPLSEVTGPAFNPAGDRLYFSSQRGKTGGRDDGWTFEVTGPFLGPAPTQ